MEIPSKIAIITGAGKGLGEALATKLVNKGAQVYGLARHGESLEKVQNKLGEKFIPVVMDVTNHEAIFSWVSKTFDSAHYPDILINNAGAGIFAKIDEFSLEQWHTMVNTNINGLFYMTSSIVPLMKKNPAKTHIVNIGSILGKTTRSEGAAYSLSKYGVQGFSESLFKELRSDGIKVSVVNPGSIATHFFEESGITPHDNMLSPSDLADVIVHLLETPDNVLIDELTVRALNPRHP